MNKKDALLKLCEKFISDNTIICPEHVYQTDCVIEGAYEFIEQVCEIVGYHKETE